MRRGRGLLQRITEGADLPGEPLPGLPLVEVAGDRRVLVENHGGVTEYGREQIRIQVRYGQVCVCGAGLELVMMTKEQLVICGRIESVHLIRGNGQ
ncbi:MAG TPA: sporulation protein [Candidatus Faecousia intestinigallinarum]|nr:sporulation protein [Candidatus Faecousia intestinigallinarum]